MVFAIISYCANTLLLAAVVVVGIPLFSTPNKEQARQGLIWGVVLLVLNTGLLLVLRNHSTAVQLWRYAGILAGGVLTFRSLTRAQEPTAGRDGSAAVESADGRSHRARQLEPGETQPPATASEGTLSSDGAPQRTSAREGALAGLMQRIPVKLRTPRAIAIAAVAVLGVVVAISLSVQARNRAEFGFANDTAELGEGITQPTSNEVPAEQTEPTAQADDTDGLVSYVEEQGGSATINAAADPDSDQWTPALKFMTAAEPFYEWVVPLAGGVDCTLGDRNVEPSELYAYVDQQESVLVDVTSSGGRIASMHVKPAVGQDGQEVLRTNRAMEVADLLGEAPGDGSTTDTEGTFSGAGSSVEDGSVWFEIRKDTYVQPVIGNLSELGDFYIDDVQVSSAEFMQKVLANSSTRGGVRYNNERILRSWLITK